MRKLEFFLILFMIVVITSFALLSRWHIFMEGGVSGKTESSGAVVQVIQYPPQYSGQDTNTGKDLICDSFSESFVTRQEFLVLLSRNIGLKPEPGAVHFVDVYDNSTNLQYIYPLLERGIIAGYQDGTLRLYDFITKNEAEIIIARAMNHPVPPWYDSSNYLTRKQMYILFSELEGKK